MVQLLRQPHARRDRVRRRARRARRASTRRGCRRSRPSTPRRPAASRRWRPSSASPTTSSCTRAINDSHAGVDRDRRADADGRAGLAIGTTSVLVDAVADVTHRPRPPDPVDARPVRGPYVVCAENGLGGKVLEHVLDASCTPTTSWATTAPTTVRRARRGARRGTRRAAAACCSCPGSAGRSRPTRAASIRGGFVNMSLETGRADLVRAVVEGVAHNLCWLAPARRGVHRRAASTRSCSSAAPPAPAQWCQVLADVLDRPVAPLVDPDHAVARGHGAARARAPRRSRPAPTSTALAGDRRDATSPRAEHRTMLRLHARPVPGRVRGPAADLRAPSTHDRTHRPTEELHEQRISLRRAPRRASAACRPKDGAADRSSPSSPTSRRDEDKTWETGKCSRHDVLRRPRPLRLHGRSVRAVRAHERAAARHVPERDASSRARSSR